MAFQDSGHALYEHTLRVPPLRAALGGETPSPMSRHYKDAKVYGLTTTATADMSTPHSRTLKYRGRYASIIYQPLLP